MLCSSDDVVAMFIVVDVGNTVLILVVVVSCVWLKW